MLLRIIVWKWGIKKSNRISLILKNDTESSPPKNSGIWNDTWVYTVMVCTSHLAKFGKSLLKSADSSKQISQTSQLFHENHENHDENGEKKHDLKMHLYASPIIQDCDFQLSLHPRNLTYQKWAIFKRRYIFQTIILGIHLGFQRCISFRGVLKLRCPPFTNPNHHPPTTMDEPRHVTHRPARSSRPTWRTFTGLRMRSERVTRVWLQRAFSKSSGFRAVEIQGEPRRLKSWRGMIPRSLISFMVTKMSYFKV